MSQPEPPQREPETDPLNAFDNEPGLPKFIPRKFVEQLEFAVEWAADESDVRQFKVTSGRLIVAVPSFLNPPLEFGDYVVSVNSETMKSKMQLYQTLLKLASRGSKETKVTQIARILIERPVEPAAVAFVRAVLLVNKKNVVDPKMPDDAVLICKNELARMRKSQHKPKTTILKEDKSELKSKGTFPVEGSQRLSGYHYHRRHYQPTFHHSRREQLYNCIELNLAFVTGTL
ncbi:unnamed protein product [Nippostrongylus brasiliensis]|uniref:PDZ domain-containing protein n=1 Tax=Nippostrongylus brasiliensis TaxID=27835 RepID=A0A0N4YJS1_NIPBR|nr:unnamed protein product [Nippostrongylus brasiliensis]